MSFSRNILLWSYLLYCICAFLAKNTRKQDFTYSKNPCVWRSLYSRFIHGSNATPHKVNFANHNTKISVLSLSFIHFIFLVHNLPIRLWSNLASQHLWKINSRNSDRQNLNWCLEKSLNALLLLQKKPELWLPRDSTIYWPIFNEVILVINLSRETLLLNTIGVPLIESNIGSEIIHYLPKGLLALLCLGALSYKK